MVTDAIVEERVFRSAISLPDFFDANDEKCPLCELGSLHVHTRHQDNSKLRCAAISN